MDAFGLQRHVVADYADYTRSFVRIADDRLRRRVEEEMAAGLLWPEPLLQLNPAFEPGRSIDELVDQGILHRDCGLPTILFERGNGQTSCVWLAVANSLAMDFLVRGKVGLHMSYAILDSQPFPRLADDSSQARAIVPRVLRLTCTGPEMVPFWNEMATAGWCAPWNHADSVPGTLDEDERLRLRAELDVIVARDLYGLSLDEMNFILEGFPTTKKYEVEKYGEFCSGGLINELFPHSRVRPTPACPPPPRPQSTSSPPPRTKWMSSPASWRIP